MDGSSVGTTSIRRRCTRRVLLLPLLELLFQKARGFLTGRRFSLHTFNLKLTPELLINRERFSGAPSSPIPNCGWSLTHGGLGYQEQLGKNIRERGSLRLEWGTAVPIGSFRQTLQRPRPLAVYRVTRSNWSRRCVGILVRKGTPGRAGWPWSSGAKELLGQSVYNRTPSVTTRP